MRLIEVISAVVNQVHIVACKIHMEGDIGMMRRVMIHQGHKQSNNINQPQQDKEEFVNSAGKKGACQNLIFYAK